MMLLHVCCAPCALPALAERNISALYFCNPNIFPFSEYERRLQEVKKIAQIYEMKLFVEEYNHDEWLQFLRNNLPFTPDSYHENQERCLACFQFRLEKTAEFAQKSGFAEFSTTLSYSRFKDRNFINRFGVEIGEKLGVIYKPLLLDPCVAHKRGLELSKEHQVYRQKYCGCEFN